MADLEIRKAYIALAIAIFERERADWQGQRGLGPGSEGDIRPSKKEILEFIRSDWFAILVDSVNSRMPIKQVREEHIASLGAYCNHKERGKVAL